MVSPQSISRVLAFAGAGFADQGGDLGEAAGYRAVGEVIHRDEVAVHVGGGQQGDGDRLGRQQGGGEEKNRNQTAHGMGTRL